MFDFLAALALAADGKPVLPPPPASDPVAVPDGAPRAPDAAAPTPPPVPRRRIVPGALQCAARVGLARDEVRTREGESATVQALSVAEDRLAMLAGKAGLPTFVDLVRTEREVLAAQDGHRRLRRAMGIPDDPDPARDQAMASCLAMAEKEDAPAP